MKKNIFLIFIVFFVINLSLSAQWDNNNSGNLSSNKAANIKLNKIEHNFGKMQQGKPQKAVFKMSNTGGKPFLITNAKGSCGCTDIVYPKRPILPGKTIDIIVTYDAEVRGSFDKTITLTMNIEKVIPVLHVRGVVE